MDANFDEIHLEKEEQPGLIFMANDEIRVKVIGDSQPEAMTRDEIKAANQRYYEDMARLVGADQAQEALNDYVQWIMDNSEAYNPEDRPKRVRLALPGEAVARLS